MKYEMMITDFDGTLGKDNEIESQTAEAVRDFIERGGKFCICTGRHYYYIKNICKEYKIEGLLATCQGSRIIDLKTEKVIYSGGLDNQTAYKIAERIIDAGYQVSVYFDDKLYYTEPNDYAEWYKADKIMPIQAVESVPEYIKERKEKALKLIVSRSDERLRNMEEPLRREIGGSFEFNTSGWRFVEIINPESSKGEAVKRLSEYYGIPYEKIITVGDAENDMRLVSGSWHGVAVGDGDERLKSVAKEVTVKYPEKPIKILLEKYCK